jgi:hypothetical protein
MNHDICPTCGTTSRSSSRVGSGKTSKKTAKVQERSNPPLKKGIRAKIYCGASKAPKNAIDGTVEQCNDRNQIRLWGLKQAPADKIGKTLKRMTPEKANNIAVTAAIKAREILYTLRAIKKEFELLKATNERSQYLTEKQKASNTKKIGKLKDKYLVVHAKYKKAITTSDEADALYKELRDR